MAGVLFVVCVPARHHEAKLVERLQAKSGLTAGKKDRCESQSSGGKSRSEENIRTQCPPSLDAVSGKSHSDASLGDSSSNRTSREYKRYSSVTTDSSEIEAAVARRQMRRNSEGFTTGRRNKSLEQVKVVVADGQWNEFKPGHRNGQQESNPDEDGSASMEQMLSELLKKLVIDNAVWCCGRSGNYYQVFFSAGSGQPCEEILRQLNDLGIGTKLNSVVSVIPCTLYYQSLQQKAESDEDLSEPTESETDEKKESKNSAWSKFMMSVRARLTVAQVVEGVKAEASLTFDFLMLLLIAAIVSALGLVENSTVILVASMLISPLMGPIMAGTFGAVIGDRHLQKMGVLNELIGLLMCLGVGFMFGIVVGTVKGKWITTEWPTEEMVSRGVFRSLWVGILVAVTSGAAASLAMLGGRTASLVGVAISASLLPPAVNAGLLWGLACLDIVWEGDSEGENATELVSHTYSPVYSNSPPLELAVLGAFSLCLTLVNILFIFLIGILVLKIKEVAPRTTKDQQQFWRHDVRIARNFNKTFFGENADTFSQGYQAAIRNLGESNEDKFPADSCAKARMQSIHNLYIQDMFQRSSVNIPTWSNLHTWSPSSIEIQPRACVHSLDLLFKTSPSKKSGIKLASESALNLLPLYNNLNHPPVLSTEHGHDTLSELKNVRTLSARNSVRHSGKSKQHLSQNKRFVVSVAEEPTV